MICSASTVVTQVTYKLFKISPRVVVLSTDETDNTDATHLFVYLNFVSSDNEIKQNNRNNGIADDTGNRRELVHLHGTYT